ncbi:MAG: UDP-N-acetylenolpyruvoylglucosamine reductase [Verrucomicrobia bacterium]|nr:MAG: UDP-N-acetylenolpyruvoylglucosamine reductase [Verrucomicrobiota bacterium]
MISAEHLDALLTGPPLRIHMIGVAGSGMSGLAALLMALGHRVSGSDKVDTLEVQSLAALGLKFATPHRAEHVCGVDLVTQSSAIKPGNAALDEALRLNIPIARRADVLASIMKQKTGILVCGMHGKTTTTAMAAHVLRQGGLDPSHYVGAEIPLLGSNAHWSPQGKYFVAEGDESDGTITNYFPAYALVLNIEPEHLDFYKNLSAIDDVFSCLIAQTSEAAIYCADDDGARRVCSSSSKAISYGMNASCHYQMTLISGSGVGTSFTVSRHGQTLGDIWLNVPGKHNAMNALAVTALATELGIPFQKVKEAFKSFCGAKRRFEMKYEDDSQMVVDDYGHHPTEIQATLSTARSLGNHHIVVMFQPHRYSRTQALCEQFGSAFQAADVIFVTDIYAANEDPIPGISGQTIVDAIKASGHPAAFFHPEVETVHQAAGRELTEKTLFISLGAGNVHEASSRLARDLELRRHLLSTMGSGTVRLYEPMREHTTLRVGGPAQFWVEPETEKGLAALVRYCSSEKIPFMVMGRGSNLLVRDGGIRGVVAYLARGEFLQHKIQGLQITAGVGVRLKQLSGFAKKAGIGGFEWMEGIPGNLGGGLRMNAGAMGAQTFDQVTQIRYCDENGEIFVKSPADLEIQYRNVPTLKCHYALAATLSGHPSSPEEIDRRLKESEMKRRCSQPIASSAGCIFKNPRKISAGQLIEELGLKNFVVGRARVSEVHGNFIVNDGGASAEEILTLIDEIQTTARQERGIELETEVEIVGENV